jgi:uncharacterized protein (TIGR03435 family)
MKTLLLLIAASTGLAFSHARAQQQSAPPHSMPANANPSFEVATIKPTGEDLVGAAYGMQGRIFSTRNTSLTYLLAYSNDMQQNQIIGAPAWANTDKFDIKAEPDTPGQPNHQQLNSMVQKLLADRFKLTFHHEKKELPAYVLVLEGTTPKIAKSDDNSAASPGFSGHGFGNIVVTNSTITDFVHMLQVLVLDRPVIDQTGLTGRYNFTLTWTPDDSQYFRTGMKSVQPSATADTPPDLFTAITQQMGMKLRAAKLPIDVLVIDHVEKPSAN